MKNIIIGAVVVMAVIVGLVYWTSRPVQIKAYEFAGKIDKVQGNTIFTKGLFTVPDHPELTDPQYEQSMQITADNNTKIIKIVQILPTAAELKKSGGMYEPAKLKSEQQAGSIADIATGITDGVFAKSTSNIYKKDKFTASEIKYYTQESPK
jgi:hypothetical protein